MLDIISFAEEKKFKVIEVTDYHYYFEKKGIFVSVQFIGGNLFDVAFMKREKKYSRRLKYFGKYKNICGDYTTEKLKSVLNGI